MGKSEFLEVLPEMVTFVYVFRSGSFSAAARMLHLTPSGVSKQITRLERAMGVQLAVRTTRRLHFTDIGHEVYKTCNALVEAAQGTMQLADRFMEKPQGNVRLSAPKAFAKHILHPAIMDFLTVYPEVNVHLDVTDRVVDPLVDRVDLVVRLTKYPPESLAARPLMRVEHILCASPIFLANCHPISHPSDLLGVNCLSIGEVDRDNQWKFLKPKQDDVEVVVEGRYVANHSEMRLDAVRRGLGVACVPDFVARKDLLDGAIQRVLPEWELEANYHGVAYLLYPPNRYLAPKFRVLIDFLVEHIREHHQHALVHP